VTITVVVASAVCLHMAACASGDKQTPLTVAASQPAAGEAVPSCTALLERLRAEDKSFCDDAELIVEQIGLQTVMVPGGAWQTPENRRLEISLWGDSWAVRSRQLDEAPPAYTDQAGAYGL